MCRWIAETCMTTRNKHNLGSWISPTNVAKVMWRRRSRRYWHYWLLLVIDLTANTLLARRDLYRTQRFYYSAYPVLACYLQLPLLDISRYCLLTTLTWTKYISFETRLNCNPHNTSQSKLHNVIDLLKCNYENINFKLAIMSLQLAKYYSKNVFCNSC